jgi:hypothetical protein
MLNLVFHRLVQLIKKVGDPILPSFVFHFLVNLQEILGYKNLVNEMDAVIKISGIKTFFLADNLKLSRSAFYSKRKRATFTIAEIEQLL